VPDEPVNSLDSAIQIYEDYLQSALAKQQLLKDYTDNKRDEGGTTRPKPAVQSPPHDPKESTQIDTSLNHAFYHLLDTCQHGNDIGCT
jgi:hypothetical protein